MQTAYEGKQKPDKLCMQHKFHSKRETLKHTHVADVTCLQNHHCAPKGSWLPTVHSYRTLGKPQSQVHDQIPWPQAVQENTFHTRIQ